MNTHYSETESPRGISTCETSSPSGVDSAVLQETALLLLKKEVYQIVGCAMDVLNGLGHGLHEKPYENALAVEFRLRDIPFVQQPRYDVLYKNSKVGEYIPDLVVFNSVVVDPKTIDAITDHERGRMLNYLKITGHQVGVILNFKRAKLEWERVVLSHPKAKT